MPARKRNVAAENPSWEAGRSSDLRYHNLAESLRSRNPLGVTHLSDIAQ